MPDNGPCSSCGKKATCGSPCALLSAELEDVIREGSGRERPNRALMEGWAPFATTNPNFGDWAEDDEINFEEEANRRERHTELGEIEHKVLIASAGDVRDDEIARNLRTSIRTIRWVRVIGIARFGHRSSIHIYLKPGDLMNFPISTSASTDVSKLAPFVGKTCRQAGCIALVGSTAPSVVELAPYCREHRRLRARARGSRKTTPAHPIPKLPTPDQAGANKLFGEGEPSASFERITPALALALLERNARNRSIRKDRIALYARDMSAGAWETNSQGLALGSNGQLYDGQHRLWSVVQSGRTVPMLVVRGLCEPARATIDQGSTRSIADILTILDGQLQAGRAVSWVRAIEVACGGPRVLSVHGIRERMVVYREAIEWMLGAAPKLRPYGRASIVAAFVFARHTAGSGVEGAMQRYATGIGLSAGAPMLVLRDFVTTGLAYGRTHERDVVLRALHAIASDLREESIDRLRPDEEHFEYFRGLAPGLTRAARSSPRS